MKIYDFAFIGAGPATLAALKGLSPEQRKMAIVLEAGQQQRAICPELKTKSCSSCSNNLCPVLNGVGGASYGFGNKICHFPASNHVVSNENYSLVNVAVVQTEELLSVSKLLNHKSDFTSHTGSPFRKHYDASVAMLDEYRSIIDAVSNEVFAEAELKFDFEVSDVSYDGRNYLISSIAGKTVSAKNLVFAVGRSGHNFLRKVLPELGVSLTENEVDIGFRLQAKSSLFAQEFFYQTDPKYKFQFDDIGTARTFCACHGGMVVPVKFASGFYADGVFARRELSTSNVALMARTKSLPISELERWCADLNSKFGKSLKMGNFDCDGMSDKEIANSIKSLIPLGPTAEHYEVLSKLVDRLFNSEQARVFVNSSERRGNVELLGPAIDRYWPKIDTNSEPIKEGKVSVIGDALGESRGIYQALVSGFIWSQHRSRRLHLTDWDFADLKSVKSA